MKENTMEKKFEIALYNVCSKLLCGQIENKFHILGIMLTGSFVTGNYHKYSDLDLYVFHNGDEENNLYYVEKTIPIQIRFQPIECFTNLVLRQGRGRPACLTCKIIYDELGILDAYIDKSKELVSKGPLPLRIEEVNILIDVLKNEPRTAWGLLNKGEVAAAALLVNEVVLSAINLYNNKNKLWMSNNNYIFSELKMYNREFGEFAEEIILENNIEEKIVKLEKMCRTVLKEFSI